MTDKELRRLSRRDLIEIIYHYQTREAEQLQKISELTALLDDRRTRIENAGSIAEAALAVNRVFEAAQAAADQFLQETKERILRECEEMRQKAGEESGRLE